MAAARPLVEIAKDLASDAGVMADRDGARAILLPLAHDALLDAFGPGLAQDFSGALAWLKAQLRPCAGLFSDRDLRGIIGAEIEWLQRPPRPGTSAEALAAERDRFLSEAAFGADPALDPDSPSRRLGELESYFRSWAEHPAFGFGIPALDGATGGIWPGEICVVSGAPGTMKTSLALNAVDSFTAREDSGCVYYCSVDMAPREISLRLAERVTGLGEAALRGRMAEAGGAAEVRRLVWERYSPGLTIGGHGDGRRMTVDGLLAECRRRGPALVVVDYLTCLKVPGQGDLEFVEDAMPKLLTFAHQYETAFLILSQMSRASRGDQAAGQVGGHSRGGGIVEELAHTEVELSQQPDPEGGSVPLVIAAVAKARHGVTGQFFSLGYDGPSQRFDGTSVRMERITRQRPVFARAA